MRSEMEGDMRLTNTSSVLVLFPFLVLLIISTAWSETVGTSPARNTITRQFDHVIVRGSDLKEHLNKSIPLMRLYALKDGKMQPVPFQIDEITDDENWVLPYKSPYISEKMSSKAKLIKDDPPEVMDENDELVFMITDVGGKAEPAVWPSGWLSADEITLTDPLTGDRAWVYLFSFAEPRDLSPVDYVEYRLPEDTKDRMYSDNYLIGFSHEVPITHDYLGFHDGVNLIDRMRMRMHMRFFYFIKFERTENDFESNVWQYKDGPVRAVRMVRSSVRLIRNFQSPSMSNETLYYSNACVMPIRIGMPTINVGIINEAFVDSGGDWRDLYGWKVRLSSDERWLTVDGKMDEVEKNIETRPARWIILKGDKKAIIIFAYFVRDYGLDTEFHYIDDDVTPNPPEFHPAQVPYVGFHIYGLEQVRGKFHLNNIIFYLNGEYSEQELMSAMNVFDNPVKISSQGFSSTNQ